MTGLGLTLARLGASVAAGETVSVSGLAAVFAGLVLSVTVTFTLNGPETVGVPEIVQVDEFIPIPLGKPEAAQL